MKNKICKLFVLLMITVCVVAFSGCSIFDFFSADSLLKPPKLTGEKAELQIAFEQAVGTDISLYTPIAGEYRGSYILFDANNDGNDEAIVFYSFNSNSSVIHMHLLTQKNGRWTSVGDIAGSGTEVYKVDFQDIGNNRNSEINVVWSLDDSKREKTLSIYRIAAFDGNYSDSLVSLASIQISDYVYCDVDGDEIQELLYFYAAPSNNASFARLIDYNSLENTFVPISEVALPFAFSSIENICFDKEDNDFRFFVDYNSLNDELFTELIVYSYKTDSLFIPAFGTEALSSVTVRKNDVLCEDFNNDGYIDIPVEISSSVSSDELTEETNVNIQYVQWFTYSESAFIDIGKYCVNFSEGYSMKIDDLVENFQIAYDAVNKITQVRTLNSSADSDIVFSVTAKAEADDSLIILPDGFLSDKADSKYEIVISAKGESYGFTENYILSIISEL